MEKIIPAKGHSFGEWTVVTPATEENEGEDKRVCSRCSEEETRVTPKLVHVHSLTKHEAIPATCEESGMMEYYSCSGCERVFSDSEGNNEITTSLVIPATGHNWGEATCKFEEYVTPLFRLVGVIGERECTICHKKDENGILLNGYEETKTPTCNETGTAVYSFDPDNYDPDILSSPDYTRFLKENGQFKTFEYEMTLPKTDSHSFGEVTYKWSDDCSLASAERECSVCGKLESENVSTVSEFTKQPTCEEKGEHTFTASFKNSAFVTQTKKEEDVLPTGHDWSEVEYTWSDDYTSVTATRVCKNDSTHTETETVQATGEVILQATCEDKGVTRYTGSEFENPDFETQTIDIDNIPALGHDWGSEIVTSHNVIDGNGFAACYRFCNNDNNHFQALFCEADKETIKEASFTEAGEYKYNADFAAYASSHAQWVQEQGLDYSWAQNFSWTEEIPMLVPTVTIPNEMRVTNDVQIGDDGKVAYGTVIEFEVREEFSASNVKANGTELVAADGKYTITASEDITVTADFEDSPHRYITQNNKTIMLNSKFTRDSEDTAKFGIGNEFMNIQILGVQRKSNGTRGVRYIAVLNDEVLQDAADYGFIAVAGSDMTSARSNLDGKTIADLPEKNIFSCKGTDNNVSGDYGVHDAEKSYKYITFAVNNIGENGVAVMFYVTNSKGKTFYAPYINKNGEQFSSCSADWNAIINAQ